MILEGKKLLITGVLNHSSIAFATAQVAQEQGAEIMLTSFGRAMRVTERAAKRLPKPPEILELDITDPAHLESLTAELDRRWGSLDGVVHAIAFAPESCLGGNFLDSRWDDVSTALARVDLLAQSVGGGRRAAYEGARRIDRRPHVRRAASVASVRLDGRGQGGTSRRRRGTSRVTSAPPVSASTWWPPAQSARSLLAGSPGSQSSRTCGPNGRLWVGMSPRRSPSPAPARRCCPTGSRLRPARSCMWTAASTRSGHDLD